jgi:hypothetical protein
VRDVVMLWRARGLIDRRARRRRLYTRLSAANTHCSYALALTLVGRDGLAHALRDMPTDVAHGHRLHLQRLHLVLVGVLRRRDASLGRCDRERARTAKAFIRARLTTSADVRDVVYATLSCSARRTVLLTTLLVRAAAARARQPCDLP